MSSLIETCVISYAAVLTPMLMLWFLSVRWRNASIVDPFWGSGFVCVAAAASIVNSPPTARMMLLAVLVTVWGVRLSLFLLWRNCGHGEDRRYADMRDKHGASFWWVSLFTVFILQSVILWWVSLPIQVAAAYHVPSPLGWWDALGMLLWAVGLFWEAVGDAQLARFQSDPANRGHVMDRGLWRYTRHPNYFGDFCMWWGLYLIAAAGGAWWTVGSPLVMSLLLMKVSGVSLLERSIRERRSGYAEYQARTNAFFPGPPRSA